MSKTEHLIAITSDGDPKHPKTWSGSPSNIVKAIESLGVTVLGIDSGLKKYQKLAYLLLHPVQGLGSIDYLRGRLARTHRAQTVQAHRRTHGCRKILHTGTLDLPMPKPDSEVDHYLFCDSTWNLWSQGTTNIERYRPKLLKLSEQLERESYAQIKHFFPISEYVRENLINHYGIEPQRITVVGTGRGKIEAFTGEKDYENGHILFVAKERFEDEGGSLLIEGFKKAQRKNPSLKLVIVGQEQYRNLIGSVPNVTVTGFIPWEQLQNLFNTAALFAMPALNEPWGLVYLEALACKIPILGLNRNSLPEITRKGQYGFLVDEPSPDCIANAILQAFSNPDKLREMGAAGQKYCLETFSWDQVAIKIASVMLGAQLPSFDSEKQNPQLIKGTYA
jgi:glycosyltransferase involved in cell wall biosynthesis